MRIIDQDFMGVGYGLISRENKENKQKSWPSDSIGKHEECCYLMLSDPFGYLFPHITFLMAA